MRSIFRRSGNRKKIMNRRTWAILLMTACGLLCSSGRVEAQAQNWQWVKSSAGQPNTTVTSIASDAQGNVFITGDFVSGNLTLGNVTIPASSIANNTVFIAKYDKNGNVLWAKSFEQGFNAGSYAVATDAQGNAYIAGTFYSWIKFGQTTLTSSGDGDIFLTKFSASGNVLWTKKGGGVESDVASGLATDSDGNVVMSGGFRGSILTFGNQSINGGAEETLYLAKFDANGTPIWLKGGAGGSSSGGKVTIDAAKNIYLTGRYTGASLTLGTVTLPVVGGEDAFVAKFTPAGAVTWAKSIGAAGFDAVTGISLDAAANVYFCGYFIGSFTFGPNTLTSAGNMDCMVAKFNANGQPAWARSGGGEGADQALDMVVDKKGQINVTGTYGLVNKNAIFNTTTLTNAGMSDLFVARYDASGTLTWVNGVGGSSSDNGAAITSDINSNLYLAGGYTSPSIAFGGITLTTPAGSGSLIFVAKYGVPPTGIDQLKMKENWSVYPNPSTGDFYIDYPKKILDVRVCNVLGQVVYQSSTAGSNSKVSLKGKPAGLYWLYVYTDEGYGIKQISLSN